MTGQLLPQRFKHRPTATSKWYFGCCFYQPDHDFWFVAAQTEQTERFELAQCTFEHDPWETIGQVIAGEYAELRWLDNGMGWRDSDE